MTKTGYPRNQVENVLTQATPPPSYRIIPRRHLRTPLGTALGDSRFCTKADNYTVLYAAPDFATAFIETVVRDRFTRKRQRDIVLKEVTERAWVLISATSRAPLRLLDLRQDGCVRLGTPTDTVNARNHVAGRSLGRSIYADHKDIDGLLFASRLTGADVYALFDRAIRKLDVMDSGLLANHPELPRVLTQYSIRLLIPT